MIITTKEMAHSLFVVGNNLACRLLYYMTRGRRALRYCGNRFSWTADPNVVIVKGRWMEEVEPLPLSLSLSPSLSLSLSRPCPCRGAETGRAQK